MAQGYATPKLESNALNDFNSEGITTIALYSALVEEQETICCFFVFQDTGERPSKTSQPVRERRVNE